VAKPVNVKAALADLFDHHEGEAGEVTGYLFVTLHGDGAFMLSFANYDPLDTEGNALIDDVADMLDSESETAH
jgi:hypothetical protein